MINKDFFPLKKNMIGINSVNFSKPYSVSRINSNNNVINIGSVDRVLNNVVKFNALWANSHSISYSFINNNNLNILSKEAMAFELLNAAFMRLGCLISRPTFKLVNVYKPITYSKAIKENIIDIYSERSITEIENSQKLVFHNNQKWIIRLFFYVREPYRCYNSKKSRLIRNRLDTIINYNSNNDNNNLSDSDRRKFNKNKNNLHFNFLEIYKTNITYIVRELSKLFNSEVELQLIQLKKPFHNSDILSNYLNLESFNYKFVQLVNRLLKKIKLPTSFRFLKNRYRIKTSSIISGVNIRLGGRTFRQKIIPRRTVQQIQRGSLANDKVDLVEKSLSTGKTKRGSYSFSVRLGHILR